MKKTSSISELMTLQTRHMQRLSMPCSSLWGHLTPPHESQVLGSIELCYMCVNDAMAVRFSVALCLSLLLCRADSEDGRFSQDSELDGSDEGRGEEGRREESNGLSPR